MNIAVFRTTSGSHFFLDYRGRWRPLADLKKCKPERLSPAAFRIVISPPNQPCSGPNRSPSFPT